MLELVQLPGLENGKTGAAVRRAASAGGSGARLIIHPHVLLLDEPLGALDLKLRQQMQIELKAIQQRGGHHVHLRHARSGRGALPCPIGSPCSAGKIEQVGTPAEVYDSGDEFVAGFVGVSNLIGGRDDRTRSWPANASGRRKFTCGSRGSRSGPAACSIGARSAQVRRLGAQTRYQVDLAGPAGDLVVVAAEPAHDLDGCAGGAGGPMRLAWDASITGSWRRRVRDHGAAHAATLRRRAAAHSTYLYRRGLCLLASRWHCRCSGWSSFISARCWRWC